MTKKDLFNAKNSSKKMEKDLMITVVDCDSFKDVTKDGIEVDVSVLKSETGEMFSSISKTVYQSLAMLKEILEEDGKVDVMVRESKSANGRDFLHLEIA